MSGMLLTHFKPCQQCGASILVMLDQDEGPKTCEDHN